MAPRETVEDVYLSRPPVCPALGRLNADQVRTLRRRINYNAVKAELEQRRGAEWARALEKFHP